MKTILVWVTVALSMLLAPVAQAQCSEEKVRRLKLKGHAVAAIAKQCDMTGEAVRDALRGNRDDEEDVDEEDPDGIPSGKTVVSCGCWGYAAQNQTFPEPRCASQLARARMCGNLCPLGGYQWRAVCQ